MSAASSAAAMISLVLCIWSATGPMGTRPPSDPTGPVRCWGRSGKDVGKQLGRARASYLGRGRRSGRRPDDQIGLGHIQPGIKQAGDDADQPRIACRSATTEDQRSLTRGARPRCVVDLQLILVGPRPVGGRREVTCRVEKGVVFMGVAFREVPGGRSRWRLPQSRDRGPCSGAPTADTAFMGLTSCRWITIVSTLARRRRVAQPASCALAAAWDGLGGGPGG
jgi:hypothetical protein